MFNVHIFIWSFFLSIFTLHTLLCVVPLLFSSIFSWRNEKNECESIGNATKKEEVKVEEEEEEELKNL